jgi:type I restriction enzyme R subunit
VMLVANKFQTGFDQPKLVAMYLDKKIGNAVEIVQTLSRLNRTFPGKDQVFIIDFVNEPDSIVAAFSTYDSGAKIEKVQSLDVIYEIKERLDLQAIYRDSHVDDFRFARFDTASAFATGADSEHKAMFAATQEPTDHFNNQLKSARLEVARAEAAYETARTVGDEDGMKRADHAHAKAAGIVVALSEFRSDLAKFSSAYNYIAQLVDLGDPELENFAAFAKLLANRLDGVPQENVDLRGITLTGFDMKLRAGEPAKPKKLPPLKPMGAGGGEEPPAPPMPIYLQQIIDKMNKLFGEAAPLKDQANFVNQVVSIAKENAVVMAQVEQNPKDQALKGNLPGAVEAAIARAMTSHAALATLLLKADKQAIGIFTNLVYDLLKNGERLDLDMDA